VSAKVREFAERLMDEVWADFDHTSVPRFYHPDMVGHHRAEVLTIEDIVERLKWDALNLADPAYDIQDIIADTDRFAIRFVCSCTLIDTAQRFTTEVNCFYRLRDGKISEFWLLCDAAFDCKRRPL